MTARRYTPFCLFMIFAIPVPLFLTACGGNGGGGASTATPTITSVTVGCSPASISTNQTSACTQTVNGTGSFNSSVTWSVSPTSMGTVSSAGVFTPTGAGTATVTATSTQDSTKSGNSTVTVTIAVAITSVSVSCNPTSIKTNQTSACTATVNGTGSFSSAVTWSISPSSIGSVSSTGIFTPATTGTATITATSAQDSSKSGSTSVTVTGTQSPGLGAWTWMSGSDSVPAGGIPAGVYGTLGTPAATNVPGGRSASVCWTDGSGNLWLFGGAGDDSVVDPNDPGNAYGGLNDLWEFNPVTKEWTWVSGSDTLNANGTYGTEGIAASSNVPGSRFYSASWIDGSGNFWLFGGGGHDSVGTNGLLNDLWQFNPSTKQWTWVSGSSVMRLNPPGDAGQPGIYGTQGIPSTSNVPGGRYQTPVSWIDGSGNLWLFGGVGFDSTGTNGYLNDLWEFTPTTKEWTWVSGSSTASAVGVYGTLGTAAAGNTPGARSGAVGWVDSNGNFWLFGGVGPNGATLNNDLWEFNPTAKVWTWVSGSSTANATGVYGTLGTPATANVPGARYSSVSWTDGSGNLWLFGGNANGGYSYLNDLWEFSPTAKEWTWMSGSSTVNATGVYGTLGVPSSSNVPGARFTAVSWTDGSGNLWLFGGGNSSTQGTVDFNDLWRYQP